MLLKHMEQRDIRDIPSCMVCRLFPSSLFIIVLTISEGGFVSGRRKTGTGLLGVVYQPLTWSIVVLSIAAVLYISAVFLTWYAHKQMIRMQLNS